VTIDAVPGKIFKGKVTEMGRRPAGSSGLTTTQTRQARRKRRISSRRDAGESARESAARSIHDGQDQDSGTEMSWAISIQALAVRTRKDLERQARMRRKTGQFKCDAGSAAAPAPGDPKKGRSPGRVVINGKKGLFRAVETGSQASRDIEITKA